MKFLIAFWMGISTLFCAGHVLASPDIELGRMLYQGEKKFASGGGAIYGAVMPGSTSACVACHGPRGQGGGESGLSVSALQASTLARYAGDAELLQAISSGKKSGGKELSQAMPRYQLTAQEQIALVAYLRVLGTEADMPRGVSQKTVRIATALPLSGTNASIGKSIQTGMQRMIQTVNRSGGIYGRHIELISIDINTAMKAGMLPEPPEPIVAWVANLMPEISAEQLEKISQQGVPIIAALGVAEKTAQSPWLSYLLPSLQMQDEWRLRAEADCLSGKLAKANATSTQSCLALLSVHQSGNDAGQIEILPMPASAAEAIRHSNGADMWQNMGEWATRIFLETLARSGRTFDHTSLMQQMQALHNIDLLPGLTANLTRQRRHAFDPGIRIH